MKEAYITQPKAGKKPLSLDSIQKTSLAFLTFAMIFAGGFFGTILGTKIGLKLPEDKIRFYFVYIIAAAIVMIVWKQWSMIYG